MELIDKDALVAEIERKLKNVNLNYVSAGLHPSDSDTNKKLQDGISKNLQSLLSFLDTLEVKEVDLEKDCKLKLMQKCVHKAYKRGYNVGKAIAKHFFEFEVEKSVNESIIRKIVDLHDEAAKHYDKIIKKENEENGFSQLAIDLLEHNVDPKELCIQYVIENLHAQKGEEI